MNYLRVFFRQNRYYTLINVLSITLGLACALVMLLYVSFHFSFDKKQVNRQHLYRIADIETTPDSKEISPMVRYPVAADLKESIPEIEAYVQVNTSFNQNLLRYKNTSIVVDKTLYASDNFCEFFSCSSQFGNIHTMLQSDASIVLTHSLAQKIFKTQNPIGETVILDNKNYTVSGVVDDPPLRAHIQYQAILSLKAKVSGPDVFLSWRGGFSTMTFVQLAPHTNVKEVETKMAAVAWEKTNKFDEGSAYATTLFLEPFTAIHAKSKVDWDPFNEKKSAQLYLLLFIGIIALIIALANYLFLSNGLLILRFKEFNIKRFLGLNSFGIIRILMLENLLLFVFSFSLALVFSMASTSFIQRYLKDDFFNTQLIYNLPGILTGLFLLVMLCAALQFLFLKRNLLVSSASLQDNKQVKNQKMQWVIALQFTFAISLLIAVLSITKQINYIHHKKLGVRTENVVNISHDGIGKKQDLLQTELRKIPGIESVSASFGIPGLETTRNGYQAEGSDQWNMYNALYVDDNFFKTFELQLVQGRNFKTGSNKDTATYIINETLAKQLGWDDPVGKHIFRESKHEIIGVVKDFHLASMYEPIGPLIISKEYPNDFYTLNIALNTSNTAACIQDIKHAWLKVMPNTNFNFGFLDKKYEALYTSLQEEAKIFKLFTYISLLVSFLGLFAITFLTMTGKVKEIGIRKVNGASVTDILRLLNLSFIKWLALAFIVAAPMAYWFMHRWLEKFAYKTALSWWIFALAGCMALGIALLTVSWQSWRAATRNPIESLRYE